jgi:hypothetical protein
VDEHLITYRAVEITSGSEELYPDRFKAGRPCVPTRTDRDASNVFRENSAGVVMWRIRIFPRYKKTESTPMIEAGAVL